MSHPLPLNLLLFTTTAGHFGRYDAYQYTLSKLERQCGGCLGFVFANRVAHIKVRPRPGEEERLPAMVAWLEARGFQVVVTRADWSRGISHQNEYLKDIRRVSLLDSVQAQPFSFFQEDDAPIQLGSSQSLPDLFTGDLRLMSDKNVLCTRYAWESGTAELTAVPERAGLLASPYFHFQPTLLRSRDLMVASNLIHANWGPFSQMQCEWAFTLAMRALVAGEGYQFLVHQPDVAHAYHIGGEDVDAVISRYAAG